MRFGDGGRRGSSVVEHEDACSTGATPQIREPTKSKERNSQTCISFLGERIYLPTQQSIDVISVTLTAPDG